jgi:HlyD family secretion protein
MIEIRKAHSTTEDPDTTPLLAANVPAIVPVPASGAMTRKRRSWMTGLLLLVLLAVAGLGGAYWWFSPRTALPPGFASGNGRLEADSVDIDTKYAARIAELRADQGDIVQTNQVVAVMDTRGLQAQLRQYQEVALQAQQALEQAKANYIQQQTVVALAQKELDRTSFLVPKGFATVEVLDQRRQQLDGANAALQADEAAIGAAEHAFAAATHQIEFYEVQIADSQLFAPKDGKIEYRVANVGEVLPAGGKVFTMLDASYVYMDIYLPTADAGRVATGSEARIVLDAYPTHVIPAQVVFVAGQAQFTPKMVETQSERNKLMFRIRVRIDPSRLAGHEALLRTGLPGVAYVRSDASVSWPANLEASPLPMAPVRTGR